MEERCSVNSPRRILSFSRNRRAKVSFPDADHRSPTDQGPKLSEVYGFVGSITTVVSTAWISGLVQTLLYADFFYYYFQRYDDNNSDTHRNLSKVCFVF
ncbi:hypothetical protein MIMGU_mgv1a026229mg [Erythranthe guttata]|uniref:Uncharacterized protein n=1 Tax=Erythranthe guttata TaxID=4155 RepID=A0A022Q6S6_ERYGU|nr:hypothetical protein MIMGU_mgv1a026229mg [Erythranthe guttata]